MPSVKINSVNYDTAEVTKALIGAIVIKPDMALVRNDGDALTIGSLKEIALFRTEGYLKVVAVPPEQEGVVVKKYVLINKHSLKKTHAVYVNNVEEHDRRPPPRRFDDSRNFTERRPPPRRS